jgi:hypothetical protein
LVPGVASVEVTYVATFDQSTALPNALDKTMWYPFAPALQEGAFAPLPTALSSGKAQWASLRTKQTITENPVSFCSAIYILKLTRPSRQVDKLPENVPAQSVNAILAAMKA